MKIILLKLIFACQLFYAQQINRIPESPYPVSQMPDTLYRVFDKYMNDSELLTLGTLQGIIAQEKPMIYRITSDEYEIWLNEIKNNFGVVVKDNYLTDLAGLIRHFKSRISNYILCNLNDNSVSVAISLAGITNSVAVTGGTKSLLDNIGITMLEDVRERDEKWFFDNYKNQINKNIFCFQKESMLKYLTDYSAFGKMITFYNSSFTTWTDEIYRSFNPNSALLGWGFDEFALVDKASINNIYVHAADFAANLSVLSNFSCNLAQKKPLDELDVKNEAHYVCFLMTDGDNVQWTLGGFASHTGWYGSSRRGETKIGWTMSPALVEIAPSVLNYYYENETNTTTGRDYFVAGPSGVGYMNPEKYEKLDEFADLTNSYMNQADLSIVNIIGNKDYDIYLEPFMNQDNIDAIFFYYFNDYAGGRGKIKWVKDKPVIYGRYMLQQPDRDVASTLAAKLNGASRDIHTSDAYSLIPVHVWSQDIDDILECVNLLDSNVIVVAPDEFVNLIKKNLPPREDLISFIPNNNETEQKYLLPDFTGTGSDSLHRWADSLDTIIYKYEKNEIESLSNNFEDIQINISVSSEYVISVSNNLDSNWILAERWRPTNVHIHGWNLTEVKIPISEYFNLGWERIYLKFEDGIPEDAWGPKVFSVNITQPKNLLNSVNEKNKINMPNKFSLNQNYPNPFNPITNISYTINNFGKVSLKVYDILGNEIQILINDVKSPGEYTAQFNGSNLASGIYFYRLSLGSQTIVKKMILVK